ncbi:hypothetical protein L208DRAFT_1128111, partial [Tricholoma matsutake]
PNAKQILPGNKAINDQMGLLRVRWTCPTPGGKCGSEHCFVQANHDDHFLLRFHELESWAAAILKGPQYAMINTPPNNSIFDTLDPRTMAAKSLLLQCCLQLNAEPPESCANTAPMLLPPPLTPGTKMSIEDFCGWFSLSAEILERLHANSYSGSHVIQHIEIGELWTMAFKPGEIAELKEAVHVWA